MRIFVFLLVSLLPASGVVAQDSVTLSLDEVLRRGVEVSRSVNVGRLQADRGEANLNALQSERFPGVRGQASYIHLSPNIPDYSIDLPPDFLPPGSSSIFEVPAIRDRYNMQMSIVQPLFSGRRLTNSIRAARSSIDALSSDVERDELDAAFRLTEVYWRLFETLGVVDALEKSRRALSEDAEDAKNLIEAGMALRSDLLAIETRIHEVTGEQVAARRNARLAQIDMNQLLHLPYGTEVIPSDTPSLDPVPASDAELLQTALSRHPELASAEAHEEAAAYRVRVARGQWSPSISAVGTYYYARPNPYIFPQEDAFVGTWEVGFSASWDLWSWGRRSADIRTARVAADLAREETALTRDAVERSIVAAQLELGEARAARVAAMAGLASSSERYRTVQIEYEEGAALTSDLLDAEAAVALARVRVARSEAGIGIARAALQRAVGRPVGPGHQP